MIEEKKRNWSSRRPQLVVLRNNHITPEYMK